MVKSLILFIGEVLHKFMHHGITKFVNCRLKSLPFQVNSILVSGQYVHVGVFSPNNNREAFYHHLIPEFFLKKNLVA